MKGIGTVKKIHIPRRGVIILGIMIIALVILLMATGVISGEEAVEFTVVSEESYPAELTNQVIPEYRALERALACMINEKVYVLVTRGEKPTSGFEISVDHISLQQGEKGSNMVVYANFKDPEPGTALSQVLNYPMQVVETELTELPEQIELRVQYK